MMLGGLGSGLLQLVTPLPTPQSPTYRAADLAREQIRERREGRYNNTG